MNKLQPQAPDARRATHPIDFATFEPYPYVLTILATDLHNCVRRPSASVVLLASSFAFVLGYRAVALIRLISLGIDSDCIMHIRKFKMRLNNPDI